MFLNAFLKVEKDTKRVNSIPNNNILDWSKFKAFAVNRVYVAKKVKFLTERVKKLMGIEENAGYQHSLLFPKCFQKTLSSGSLKVGIVW